MRTLIIAVIVIAIAAAALWSTPKAEGCSQCSASQWLIATRIVPTLPKRDQTLAQRQDPPVKAKPGFSPPSALEGQADQH